MDLRRMRLWKEFTQDGGPVQKWGQKGHANEDEVALESSSDCDGCAYSTKSFFTLGPNVKSCKNVF